ncbi:hypothetical protein ACWDBW_43465 [Streptomyces sp. NPDC001107]
MAAGLASIEKLGAAAPDDQLPYFLNKLLDELLGTAGLDEGPIIAQQVIDGDRIRTSDVLAPCHSAEGGSGGHRREKCLCCETAVEQCGEVLV